LSTTTKTGGGAKVIIIALAVVLGFAAWNSATSGGPEDDLNEKVSLRVDFEPKERAQLVAIDERVRILVTCECVLVVNDVARLSPWTKTVQIPRGAKLTLNASQAIRGKLSCSVQGIRQGHTESVGTVVCTHN
jgi:hypothetical protein